MLTFNTPVAEVLGRRSDAAIVGRARYQRAERTEVNVKPTYVTLAKFTEEGFEDIRDIPDKVEEIKELKRSLGGEPLGFFLTFG